MSYAILENILKHETTSEKTPTTMKRKFKNKNISCILL